MQPLSIYRLSLPKQFLLSTFVITLTAAICFVLSPLLHYRVVAFVLLLVVSVIAVVFDIIPVLFTAVLTAIIWDYFFLPPRFTLQVGATEDRILLMMYLLVAIISAILTSKIRMAEKKLQDQQSKANSIKLYNTLLNSLSHELRTPIAAIIGAIDTLQTNSAKLTPLNRFDLHTEVSKAALRLNLQVENLLNMSRLESGEIRPKADWCDISELIYDLVGRLEQNKPAQHISISINPDLPLFRLDKGLLEQVLHNLLTNAINYIPDEGKISIAANCYADVLEITIADSGSGFPEDEIGLVFDKFYRLKNTTSSGTGLGLSIVKGFTEALGGSVQLSNSSRGGAHFSIRIPAETSYLKNLKNE